MKKVEQKLRYKLIVGDEENQGDNQIKKHITLYTEKEILKTEDSKKKNRFHLPSNDHK